MWYGHAKAPKCNRARDTYMSYDLCIRGGTIVTAQGDVETDLWVENGKIVEIGCSDAHPVKRTVNATGLLVFPGILDAHVHFNEPGRQTWEGIATGSQALAAGGGTCFFDMPLNASPPTLDASSFDRKWQACQAKSLTDFAFWGGLTPHNLARLPELAACGVIGFKAFMCNSGIPDFEACDPDSLLRGMRIAADLGLPVAVHAEDQGMTTKLTEDLRNQGSTTIADYVLTRPVGAEVQAVTDAIELASQAKCKLHIVHISHPQVLAVARQQAIAKRVDLTCETCPHYLLLDTNDLLKIGVAAKCAPPLRAPEDRQQMRLAVIQGMIDTISSDHSPAPRELKEGMDFLEAWGGISGIQITLRGLLTLGVPNAQIVKCTAGHIARRFRLAGKGELVAGNDADFTILDPLPQQILSADELRDRHKFSPYLGRLFRGKVVGTYLRGEAIFDNGQIVESMRGRGKLQRPSNV